MLVVVLLLSFDSHAPMHKTKRLSCSDSLGAQGRFNPAEPCLLASTAVDRSIGLYARGSVCFLQELASAEAGEHGLLRLRTCAGTLLSARPPSLRQNAHGELTRAQMSGAPEASIQRNLLESDATNDPLQIFVGVTSPVHSKKDHRETAEELHRRERGLQPLFSKLEVALTHCSGVVG